MSFKAIETQEELDRIIQDRLTREREKYSDYEDLKNKNTALETQISTLQATIDESNATIKAHDETVAGVSAKISGFDPPTSLIVSV